MTEPVDATMTKIADVVDAALNMHATEKAWAFCLLVVPTGGGKAHFATNIKRPELAAELRRLAKKLEGRK